MTKLYALLIALAVLATSCGTLRKNKSSKREKVETEQSAEKKEIKAASSDSASSRFEHNSDSTGVVIEFDNDTAREYPQERQDTVKHYTANQVFIKPDGTIEAKGRLKSVVVNKKQTRSSGDSAQTVKRDTVIREDRSTAKTEVLREEKTKQVKRSTPWYMYALALLAGITGGLYIDYRTGGNVLWWIMGLFRRRKSSNDRAG